MPFRRPSDDAPLAAERVHSVLTRAAVAHPAGGWVPEPDESEHQPLGNGASVPPPAAVEAADEVEHLVELPQPTWRAEPGPPPLPSPLGEPRPAREPRAPAPDEATSVLRLPAALASGRLDPGRRGAVALVVAALLAALVTGLVVLRDRPQEVAAPEVEATGVPLPGASPMAGFPAAAAGAAPGATAPPTEVVVAVAGKVVRPGLVRLPPGSRVDDAVRAAGGPLPGAGTGLLNLARLLVDGEQVLVGVDPPPGAPAPAPGAAVGGPATGGLLDLNAATVADLDGLPGIGPVLAQRIVDWRTEHGRFASVEQLREVTGIGESKYADLESKVAVP